MNTYSHLDATPPSAIQENAPRPAKVRYCRPWTQRIAWVAYAAVFAGCPAHGTPPPQTVLREVQGGLNTGPWLGIPADATPGNAVWGGKIRLLGTRVQPAHAEPGGRVTLTTWYALDAELAEDWRLFLHAGAPGGEMNLFNDDHEPLSGLLATTQWRPGEVLEDVRGFRVASHPPTEIITLHGGFYRGTERLPVQPATAHDGHQRVLLATVAVGPGRDRPEYTAPRLSAPAGADGWPTDADWGRAPRVGPFMAHDGRHEPGNATHARLLWDDTYLFIRFECADTDAWAALTRRDDPLHDEEVVGLLLDADADTGTHADAEAGSYVELLASPADVHSDATYTGRRRGRNAAFDSTFTTRTIVRGSLGKPDDVDEGWTSDWRIPWKDLPDLPTGGVTGGARMKANLLRVERIRYGGRVVGMEASAWHAPLSADLHNVRRLGWLILGK